MKTISTLIIALGAVGFATAETILYAPSRTIAEQQITVHPWGSGTINGESEEYAYEGTTSIRISTKNLFSGGQIFFAANPDLSKEYGDKNALLQLTFRVADNSSSAGGGGKFGGGRLGGVAGAGGGAGPQGAGGVSGGGGRNGPPGRQGGPLLAHLAAREDAVAVAAPKDPPPAPRAALPALAAQLVAAGVRLPLRRN